MYKRDFYLENQQIALKKLTDSAYKVFSALCISDGPFSLTSLAIMLEKSERSIRRAIDEIKSQRLWLVKFQVLNDISVRDSINTSTIVNGNNTYPPGRNKARVKEHIISLLTRDEKRLRVSCKLKGFSVEESTDRQTLVDVLRPYMVRFINHFDKPNSTFLDVTEKQMEKHFEYWLLDFTYGKGRKRSKHDEQAKEAERLFANAKLKPINEVATQTELYAEMMRVEREKAS